MPEVYVYFKPLLILHLVFLRQRKLQKNNYMYTPSQAVDNVDISGRYKGKHTHTEVGHLFWGRLEIIGTYHYRRPSMFDPNLAGSENLVSQRIIWQHSLNLFEIIRWNLLKYHSETYRNFSQNFFKIALSGFILGF